jgi:CDP-diacylglycerol--glycerol-3-phosphate 3-phosphatidyltransferase
MGVRGPLGVLVPVVGAVAKVFGTLRDAIADGLLGLRISPNAVTLLGPLVSLGVALAWARGEQRLGGWLLVATGATDLIDGTMARRGGRATPVGGFLDAVADRYSDLVVLAGLILHFANLTSPVQRGFYLMVAALCVSGSIVPAYVRARAETLISSCKVGYFERGERTAALFVGAIAGNLHVAALLVALLGNWLAIERILYAARVLAEPARPVGGLFWRHARVSPPHATLSFVLVALLVLGHHLVPRP